MAEKPVETAIASCLQDNLAPVHLEVVNESYMHNVPKGAETHFKVLVVSDKFEGQALIKVGETTRKAKIPKVNIPKAKLFERFPSPPIFSYFDTSEQKFQRLLYMSTLQVLDLLFLWDHFGD